MTALPVTDPSEELAIRIWAKLWKQGLNTNQIARRLGVAEFEIWNRLDRVKELARS